MRPFRFLALILPMACATATRPPPAAPPTASPAPAARTGGRADPVVIELSEITVTVDAKGDAVEDEHDVYRVLVNDPPASWSSVYAAWRPWDDDPPTLDAVVVGPDGTTTHLDKKTVVDQPEPREDGILSDGKMRVAPLPGLTPGAVVDRHVRTVHRAQLVAGWSTGFGLAGDIPVKRKRIVLDVPRDAPLSIALLHSDLKPRREEKDDRLVLTFDSAPAPPSPDVPFLSPREAWTWPVLRVSTVASWQAAARAWTARAEQQIDVDKVAPLARSITKAATTRDDKVKAVLAWLRRNIRYTGLELGESAWVPSTSAQVLERKFGDCKDLALLTVAMLRSVGVDADVALVRSSGLDVSPEIPGLSPFDHAIVHLPAAPDLWLDPTNPFIAYGEMTGALLGRRALLARDDTTGLTVIQSRGTSRLDALVTTTLSEHQPARFERVRDTDGWLFSYPRELAMKNIDEYRKNLEKWAHDAHNSKQSPVIALGDPFASAPLHETLTVPDSSFGVADGPSAEALLVVDQLFNPVDDVTQLDEDGDLAKREAPLFLPMTADAKVVNRVVPPPGYRLETLPDDIAQGEGPVAIGLHWAHDGDAVLATLTLKEASGTLTADEARDLVALVSRIESMRVGFKSTVFAALEHGRYVTAVREAKGLTGAGDAPPAARALVAYALASAGLAELARPEAEAALRAAPDDVLVRNRVAYAFSVDEHGVELGKTFARKRVLEICKGTLDKHPDDEWSQRLYVLAAARNEHGVYLGPGVDFDDLAKRAQSYRDKTESTQLDDVLIDSLLRLHAWKELATLAAKLQQTPRRDAVWLAADVSVDGADKAIAHALHDKRYNDTTAGNAVQMLLMSRAYASAEKLVSVAAERNGRGAAVRPFVELMQKLKPCTLVKGDRSEPILRLMRGVVDGDDKEIASAFDVVDEQHAHDIATGARNAFTSQTHGQAIAGDTVCDVMQTATTLKSEPLPPYGEVVSVEPNLPGMFPPMTALVVHHKDGWRIVSSAEERLAVDALDALDHGDAARAATLLRVLRRVSNNDSAVVAAAEHGEWTTTVPWWAASIAVQHAPTRGRALAWMAAHVGDIATGQQASFAASALYTVMVDDGKPPLALGSKLAASASADVHRIGARLEIQALRRLGRFAEAKARVAEELKRTPDDTVLQSMEINVAADLGDLARARSLAVSRAALADEARAGDMLNNAAWYSIYDGPDDAAVQQAERSVQIKANAARLNTLAVVDAELGRFDEAASALHRQLAAEPDNNNRPPHASTLFVFGRLAEALGYTDAAKADYRKIVKRKDGSADDVWRLAQRHLRSLAHP